MTKISNYYDILDELVSLMIDLQAKQLNYETDIYMYIDEEGKGTLELFPNPGGNSWLADDHITIYRDMPHYDDYDDNWPVDEEGNAVFGEEYREYLEDMRSDFVERAYVILDEAEIDSI